MRIWREIAGDRWSGGVLRLLLAVAFVFQAGLAGRAAAAMVAPDPLTVICSTLPDGAHRPAEPGHRHDCPCAELCAAGLHMPALAALPETNGIPIRFAARIEIAVDHSAPSPFRPVAVQHPVRGPPVVSIRS
ncbi:hypothetical protein [Aureimonas leprariae]|uniref:DUF2946 domain-containing protein n=1 Tax=Plantimonas leprariae TaxID=2615207 RepID=A0A7V7PLL8_9HYPH|nr:hypothetical protein [Aureimonas leprariae]KAB0677358.1 hypothetical protein F6X38_18370 [Aureimonas leprariae]